MSSPSIVVCGCGSIGKRHLRNLLALGVTSAIAADPRPERRHEVEEQFEIETRESLTAALERRPAAALICSPTSEHVPQALEAARAGCHLLIEKPLSHTLEGIAELRLETEARRLHAVVASNYRFHPGLRRLKELIDEGALGRVYCVRAHFGQYLPDWHPWEDYRLGYSAQTRLGGGAVLDRVHEIEYLMWLLGDVRQVFAMIDRLSALEIDSEDAAEIVLRFASGAIGSVHVDYLRRNYTCRLDVTAENGTAEWLFERDSLTWYSASDKTSNGVAWEARGPNAMYLDQMRHFLRVLAGEEAPEQDLAAAERVVRVALAIKQSGRAGSLLAVG
jgi:predicted dehydrogenase